MKLENVFLNNMKRDHLMLIFFCFNQIAKCFQQECSKHFEGFYLDDSYNRHVPPGNISTIFDLQHVQDIVKVLMFILLDCDRIDYNEITSR